MGMSQLLNVRLIYNPVTATKRHGLIVTIIELYYISHDILVANQRILGSFKLIFFLQSTNSLYDKNLC